MIGNSMKVCLNLSGQIRLRDDENLINKINYFKEYLNFDKIFMHVWWSDYLTYHNELHEICMKFDCSISISQEVNFDQKILDSVSIIKHHLNSKSKDILSQFFGIHSVFQLSINEDFDIYIRCRFDNKFDDKLNLDQIGKHLSSNHPTAIFPSGGDWCNGLGDVFYAMNKNCGKLMKNFFYDTLHLACMDTPLHSEGILRAFFINLHNVQIFRMPFSVIIFASMNDDQNFQYSNKNTSNDFFCTLDNVKFQPEIVNDIWNVNLDSAKTDSSKSNEIENDSHNGISYKKINNYYSYKKLNLQSTFKEIYWDPFSLKVELTDEIISSQCKNFDNLLNNEKVTLEDLHFVIITKIDNNYRLNNLQKVIAHLNKFFNNTIYIAEYDNESKIEFSGNYQKHLIQPISNGFWRNYAANQLYEKIGPIKFLFNLESDVIFDPRAIINCYNLLKENKFNFCMPFNGFQFWLNEKATKYYNLTSDFPSIWKNVYGLSDDFETFYFDNQIKNDYLHSGYCYMINFDVFKSIGLENQNFVKHGYDDTERIARFLKNGHEIFYSNHFCFHLWHPRNKTNLYYDVDDNNRKEFLRMIQMSPLEFKVELTKWHWLNE